MLAMGANGAEGRLNIEMFTCLEITVLKIRRSQDRLIFNVGQTSD